MALGRVRNSLSVMGMTTGGPSRTGNDHSAASVEERLVAIEASLEAQRRMVEEVLAEVHHICEQLSTNANQEE